MHPRKACYRYMPALICQLRIYLIRDNVQVMLYNNRYKLLKFFLSHNSTCRIIRERKHQNLSLVCYTLFKLLSGKLELILFLEINYYRLGICHNRTWQIRYITWLWNKHFISRIYHCTKCKVYCLASTDCYHNLMNSIIMQVIFS